MLESLVYKAPNHSLTTQIKTCSKHWDEERTIQWTAVF